MFRGRTDRGNAHEGKRGRSGRKIVAVTSGVFALAIASALVWHMLPTRAAVQGNLAAYWKFDESTTGSTAADASGHGNNATPTNAPVPDTDIPAAMNDAFDDTHSISFNGSTQYLTAANDGSFDNTDAVSVSTWVKMNETTGIQTFVAKWQVGVKQQWTLQQNGGKIHWWTGDGGTGTNSLDSSTTLVPGTWYHVTATATNGSKKLYINGALDASSTSGAMGLADGINVTIGSKWNSSAAYFEYLNGNLDDVRVYNRVLSASEIDDLASGKHTTATWTGATSTDYATGSNWDTGAVPDAYTNVVVATGATREMYMSGNTSVADLTIQSGGVAHLAGNDLTMNDGGAFSNDGKLYMEGTETLTGFTNDADSGQIHYVVQSGVTLNGLIAGNTYHDLYFQGPGGTVNPGAALTVNGNFQINSPNTFNLGGNNLTVGGLFYLHGGTVNGGSGTVAVSGNWQNDSGGSVFTPGTSTVNLTGINQTITGNNTFYNLSKTVSSTDTVKFQAGKTQTITNNLTLKGVEGNLLPLLSSSLGSAWSINATGATTDLRYLYVQDSNNTGGDILVSQNSVDGSRNTDWDFAAPTATSLSPADGGWTGDSTPTLSFTTADSDSSQVKYQLQVDNSIDFDSPEVDHTSSLAAPGASSYTVGSALSDDEYYWRVKVIDDGDMSSDWVVANSGAIAFKVDTAAPSAPGTPAASTGATDTTPIWSWTSSSDDGGSGLGTDAYTVEWSENADFSGATTDTTSSVSYANTDALTDGDWYFRVKATDRSGNESSWSPSGHVYIGATQLTGGSAVTYTGGSTVAITDLQVTSTDTTPSVSVKLYVVHGTLHVNTDTGLTFYDLDGTTITEGQPSDTANLQFSGSLSNVNAALSSLHYTRTDGDAGTDKLSASLIRPGEALYPGNDHLYQYIPISGGVNWNDAKNDAASRTRRGADGYLATITSAGESKFIEDQIKNASWIGASDEGNEEVWTWRTGPEAGTQFWQGTGLAMGNRSGYETDGQYAHWYNSYFTAGGQEPNNSDPGENCAQLFYYESGEDMVRNGFWNDEACSSTLPGYVVEYGAPGNLPLISAKDINITTEDPTKLTGGSSVTNESGAATTITDLQVTSSETNPNVAVRMYVSHGTIHLNTTTGLTFYDLDGTELTGGQPSDTADLHISGTMDNVNAALATLQYTRISDATGTDTLSASLVQPGEVPSSNNHLYEYVAGPSTWREAKDAAAASSKYGAQGYLATITSKTENDFIQDRLKSDSWIGASDSGVEGEWRWVTGPEYGQQFWQGSGSGSDVDDMFVHWNNPLTGGTDEQKSEPNNSGSNEHCAEFYAVDGLWNDQPCSSSLGYIVEYGAPGNLPVVSSKDISITTTDTTSPTKPGTPSATSPTKNNKPTVGWTAATDSGTGLDDPAYTLQWSEDADFDSISGFATTGATSLTLSDDLSDGSWYFRVIATDNIGNTSVSNVSNAVIIDTTLPIATANASAVGQDQAGDTSYSFTVEYTDNGSGIDGDTIDTDDVAVSHDEVTLSVTSASWNAATHVATYTITPPGGSWNDADNGTWNIEINTNQVADLAGNYFAGNDTAAPIQVNMDTTGPDLNAVTGPQAGIYTTGEHLDFHVFFNGAVTVTTTDGTPYLPVTLDTGGLVRANYLSGSSTDELVFRYTVASGDFDNDGVELDSAIILNDGTIKDPLGNTPELLLHDITPLTNVLVDALGPETPSATPAGGNYASVQEVSLSSNDLGGNPVTIYYTTDGSTPDSSSRRYTDPITISKDQTLKAIAYDVLNNASDVMEEAYNLPPAISAIQSTYGTTLGKEVITWTTDEVASSQVSYGLTASLGETTPETNTSPRVKTHSVTLENLVPCSIYHFSVTSKDANGNSATSDDGSFITDGCAGLADVISHNETSLTSTGGTLTLGGTTVIVPSGAVSSNFTLQIKKINSTTAANAIGAPADHNLVAGVFDIKILKDEKTAITNFAQPIMITLSYNDPEIVKLIESTLAIYRWDEGTGWVRLDNCTVAAEANTVTCTTTHFSTFSLYGNIKPISDGSNDSRSRTGGELGGVSIVQADDPTTGGDTDAETHNSSTPTTTGRDDQDKTGANGSDATTSMGIWRWLFAIAILAVLGLLVVARRRKRE